MEAGFLRGPQGHERCIIRAGRTAGQQSGSATNHKISPNFEVDEFLRGLVPFVVSDFRFNHFHNSASSAAVLCALCGLRFWRLAEAKAF
jgi:hypothetical protein